MNTDRLIATIADAVAESIGFAFCPRGAGRNLIPVGISARHLHLRREHIDILFGKGYRLSNIRKLSQPGVFLTEDFVELIGPGGKIERLRVLGPEREETQVELARSDARRIGMEPPVRPSGSLRDTPGAVLRTDIGALRLSRGVIIPDRHLHLSETEARGLGLADGDRIRVFVGGDKPGVMEGVLVRAGDGHALDFHIDADDANAFGLRQGMLLPFEKERACSEALDNT
jgi:putative phosphotransacetylase